MIRIIPPQYQQYRSLWVPVAILILVVVLSLSLGREVLLRVFETRGDIQEARQQKELLQAKLNTLSSLDQRTLQGRLQTAVTAIPSDSPGLFAISALRGLTNQHNLTISNLSFQTKEEGEESKGARSLTLTFELEGGLLPTISFLNDLRGSAPLIRVNKVRFTIADTAALVNMQVRAIWAPLPEKIGQVDEPIESLTSEEEEVLGRLENLRRPQVAEVVPAPPQGRDNPFAF